MWDDDDDDDDDDLDDENPFGDDDDNEPFGDDDEGDPWGGEEENLENEDSENEDSDDEKDKDKEDKQEKDDKNKKEDVKAKVEGKSKKPSLQKMKNTAKRYGFPAVPMPFPCPICKQNSLFSDSMMKNFGRVTIFAVGAAFGAIPANKISTAPRFVCLNPRCKSYYVSTGDKFGEGVEGKGKMTVHKNWFYIQK